MIWRLVRRWRRYYYLEELFPVDGTGVVRVVLAENFLGAFFGDGRTFKGYEKLLPVNT
jgi:predicted membrane protein